MDEILRTEVSSDRILTVPNALSFLRLLGVPLFLWLIIVQEADGWALAVLAASAFTDWLDGKLARRWNQVTRVGQLLDPIADRLYIFATVVAFVVRDIIPLWFAAVLVSRDIILAIILWVLRRRSGVIGLPVHFLGKAATFCLLYAFPLLLLGDSDTTPGLLAKVFGWAFAIWGAGLYWWAGLIYILQAWRVMRAGQSP